MVDRGWHFASACFLRNNCVGARNQILACSRGRGMVSRPAATPRHGTKQMADDRNAGTFGIEALKQYTFETF